jgi:hypothetical protein
VRVLSMVDWNAENVPGVFKKQDLLFLDSPGLFLAGSALIIWLGFCVVIFFVLFIFLLCRMCPMLPVPLDLLFLIAPSIYSNVYSH